jgi:hypothetical protein
MPLFFRLSTPKTILMILTRKGATRFEYCALRAHGASHSFTSLAGLWAFCNWWEEHFGESTTFRNVHPLIIGLHSLSSELQ